MYTYTYITKYAMRNNIFLFFFSSVFHFLLLLNVFSFAFRGVRPRTTYGGGRFFASSPNHLAPGSRIVIAHKPVVNRIRRASGSPCSRDFSITRYSPPPPALLLLSFVFVFLRLRIHYVSSADTHLLYTYYIIHKDARGSPLLPQWRI